MMHTDLHLYPDDRMEVNFSAGAYWLKLGDEFTLFFGGDTQQGRATIQRLTERLALINQMMGWGDGATPEQKREAIERMSLRDERLEKGNTWTP